MKKIISIAAAAIVALGVTAAPASAETLYRNGANKVTIKPVGAPAGSAVTKAKVTVKKGKKTVAKNKNFYKAKKGTYKVTSVVTYRPQVTKTATVVDNEAFCTITSQKIATDATRISTFGGGSYSYYEGDVTIERHATCDAKIAVGGKIQPVTWNTWWLFEDSVYTEVVPGEDRMVTLENDLMYQPGDGGWRPTGDMKVQPTYQTLGSTKVAKSTRTVTVK